MRKLILGGLLIMTLLLAGCGDETPGDSSGAEAMQAEPETETTEVDTTEVENTMRLFIGETEVPVTWEINASVKELEKRAAQEPLTIQMSMYGGFEQVGPIGDSIVRDDEQTTTAAGDIVLYSGNQIVIFYGSNTWDYTRLGHVDLSQEEMEALLGNGDVIVTLQMEEE